MKISQLYLLFLTILTVFGCAIWFLFPAPKAKLLDAASVNDIAKTIESHWEELKRGNSDPFVNSSDFAYDLDYVIVDKNWNVVYMTKPELRSSLSAAIEHQDTIVDLESNENIIGKLIISNPTTELLANQQNKYKLLCIAILGCTAIISAGFVKLFHKNVIRPFHKLQEFAQQVAAGNLTLPLFMDRQNFFGSFTESFDLMRTQLAKAREKEALANQSKKEMIASLSHDIRTPVASIKAVAELMQMQTQDDKSHKNLTVIMEKSDQICLLVNNLLHSTLDELQELNVVNTVESSLLLYEMIHNADYKNLMKPFVLPECLLSIDLMRAQQIFDNIISNSYKYAGTKMELSAACQTGYLLLEFHDYGQGVGDDELPFLRNRYYQGKNALGNSGSGLGLYLSHYFIQQMGGDLTCSNTIDGFTVSLFLLLA